MKKQEFEDKVRDIESKYPDYKDDISKMFHLQYKTNKLFYMMLAEFNEKIEGYNKRLRRYTIAIMVLILVMLFSILKN